MDGQHGGGIDAGRPSAEMVRRFLRPGSIAIVGASPTRGALGNSVLQNLRRAGYAGALHLINPKRSEIEGLPCVASLADAPAGIDCVVLAIPRDGVREAVAAAAARGSAGVVVFSAGFAEDGEAGLAAQAELAAIARSAGMVLEGPNCLGFVNHVDRIPVTFVDMALSAPERPAVAIVSQSGAMAAVLGVALQQKGVAVSYSVSTGNEAASGVEDYLAFMLEDAGTRAVAMIVEQFRQPQRLLALARRAHAVGKPVVLLHPGRSAAARDSAKTHTGALAGDDAVMRCLVSDAGILIVETLEELIDTATLFSMIDTLPTAGAAVLTESGAFKALTLDFCADVGLELPPIGQATHAALRAVLPVFVPPSNPLDLTAQALVDPDLYRRAMEPLLADPAYGVVVLGLIMTNPATAQLKLEPITAALRGLRLGKPVVFAALDDGAPVEAALIDGLRAAGVACFPSPERMFRALARVIAYARRAAPGVAEAVEATGVALTAGVLAEHESKQVLAPYGIAFPASVLAVTLEAAQAAAARIGFPVVLKAQAAALAHKTEAGGVVLNLGDAAALAAGWARLHASVAAARPGLVLDGVLVEAMSPRGVELIVGGRRDPDWGPVLLVGTGGVFAEAFHDVRLLPAHLSEAQIAAEIDQLRGAALLRGFRGAAPADVPAAAAMVQRLGAFLRAHPEVAEVELNPLIVYAHGQGAVALDALITTGD